MAITIPGNVQRLLDGPNYVHLATPDTGQSARDRQGRAL